MGAQNLSQLRSALSPRYAVESEIGRGGMATVYLATDTRLGRQVAVKVLRPELAATLAANRFEREIKIAAGLSHRHLVPVHDCGEAGGFLYFVMPFVDGLTLRQALDRDGSFDLESTLAIARDVAEGLGYAHERGFVHRDIKPENILLTSGYAVLTDFGVARALEIAGGDTVTSAGVILGTPTYMSPEQADGKRDLGARSDMYSLACVIHEMLTGKPPFQGRTLRELLARKFVGTTPSAREIRPDLPRDSEYVIQRALAKTPEQRFDSVIEFVDSLDAAFAGDFRRPARDRWAAFWRKPAVRWAAVPVLAAAIALPMRSLLQARRAPPFTGMPHSAVVLPFTGADQGASELASTVAEALTRQLNEWESVEAVPRVSLAGTMFDLGIFEPTIGHVDDGIRVASAFDVQVLVVVSAGEVGDTAFVDATLFDPGSGRQIGVPFHARGPPTLVSALVEPIARGILALEEPPIPLEDLRRASANPQALGQEAAGTRALESWRLGEAERSFREAVDLDSTYAMAKHRLAQTLYWRAARAPGELRTLGPEIAELSASAVANSAGLAARDSLHIRAFFSFQLGDYADARSQYRSLIASNAADVYALLMLGSVEFRDPWLTTGATGALTPRANRNVAIAAFSESVRLQPNFHLGYGHLFDIYRELRQAIDLGGCTAFQPPGDVLVAPWEPRDPGDQIAFCPVPIDSLTWATRREFAGLSEFEIGQGATRIFDTGVQLLKRWGAYAPANPQPHSELHLFVTQELGRDAVSDPNTTDSLISVALEAASVSIGLGTDTTAADLIGLGLLRFASGDRDAAIELTHRGIALAGPGDSTEVASAANLFMAIGQPDRASDLISWSPIRRYARDPSSGAMVAWGAGQRDVDRLRVLGASGVSNVGRELGILRERWSPPNYSSPAADLLAREATPFLAIGLAFDREALALWDAASANEEPLWRALFLSVDQPAEAASELSRALGSRTPDMSHASEAFLKGLVALRLGQHERSIRWLARLDSIQPDFRSPDVTWALRPVSLFLRGAALEASGDTATAATRFSQFTTQWIGADSTAMPLVAEAAERLGRVRSP